MIYESNFTYKDDGKFNIRLNNGYYIPIYPSWLSYDQLLDYQRELLDLIDKYKIDSEGK